MLNKILRFVITLLAAIGGFVMSSRLVPLLSDFLGEALLRNTVADIAVTTIVAFLVGGFVFGVIGYLLAPFIIRYLWTVIDWVETRLNKMPVYDVLAGSIGMAIGLILSNLLGSAFLHIPYVGSYVPGILSIILGYLGINIAIRKRGEFVGMLEALPWIGREKEGRDKEKSREKGPAAPEYQYKILDTSVIIDGRIADICQSGFIEGTLLIPGFVLEELQHIADSSDLLKRNRGRRGLDILNRIQKELGMYVQISNRDFEDISEVDSKLVKLAQVLQGKIVTNDYNLNKVAEIQGVPVLNINELSNAVKPVVLPGEEMVVHVVKDGKEFGQGVAYLDDGTMIVVDGGKKHMGETIGVMVTSVLQTAAGRMIFAKPKLIERGA
ncbi:putative PIN and TRAM-domain containing protein YacL [Propionispora sp. 2/2-37]|nr:PIN/TRAM domain-containing protein [Propionispora sp. 2/2-37]CUH97743.1 putative PIN and TRAM-domain containing protein YacL [Propionispora sp. 2/2-37]